MRFDLVPYDFSRTMDEVLRIPGTALNRSAETSPGPQAMPIEDAVGPVLPSSSHRSQEDNDPEKAIGLLESQSLQEDDL